MERITLGRTGLEVSQMGLGAGGPSQIGKKTGKSKTESANIVVKAFEAGVNFIDTAEEYGTEPLVGMALKELPRDQIVISTKKSSRNRKADEVAKSCEESLQRLGTNYIDVYSLHGVFPWDYERCREELYPELLKLKEAGKIRYIGVTEMFNSDKTHEMFDQALDDDLWDVGMIGFNILNQTASRSALKKAIANNVGIQVMFAVRKALSDPDFLVEQIKAQIDAGTIDASDLDDLDHPLDFLVHKSGAVSVPDAAYRFCRFEPGTHVILSGTGNPDHLLENIGSFDRPALPHADVDRLKHIFRNVVDITGQ
ncbi:TPA: aldo/keto reductase [Candidatus Latescibacteria bacterium]|nr:aldo/keto reductase [Candidatus Latescibacterota bacterium]